AEAILSVHSSLIPRLGWLITAGAKLGFSAQTTALLAWLFLLLAGMFLIVGLFCRTSAVIAWILHLCATKSAQPLIYGMDNFTTIGLFYLMLAPLPDKLALDWRISGRSLKHPRVLGFWRRVLQVHLCFIYFFGGIAKCVGSGWWNGSSIWRALTRPPFNVLAPELLIRWKS